MYMTSSNLTHFADDTNVASKCKNLNTLADTICWYMSNKLTINFEKTNAILFSLNEQNDCFFKLGESARKIERKKKQIQ